VVARRRAVPDAGDLVWLTFDPQAGHEQAGRRPALVLSPAAYNGKAGLALVCPITPHSKGYPFEVLLPRGGPVEGVVLSDHLKSVDWQARRSQRAGRAPEPVVVEVLERLRPLLGF
jgi:mRNA interferase MazF